MFYTQLIYYYDHINDNSWQHKSDYYWTGETLKDHQSSGIDQVAVNKFHL